MELDKRIYNADRAREILENEMFIEAFDKIEKDLYELWQKSSMADSQGRENLFRYQRAMKEFKANLMTLLDTGKLARLELDHKKSLKEKAKSLVGLT